MHLPRFQLTCVGRCRLNRRMKLTILTCCIGIISLTGCSLTDKNKLEGLAYIAGAKTKADGVYQNPADKAAYTAAEKEVGKWISQKTVEADLVAQQWLPFGTVNLGQDSIPPQLTAAVEAVSPNVPTGAAAAVVESTVIVEIAEQLRKAARDGRIKEAESLKKMLEEYRWKPLP